MRLKIIILASVLAGLLLGSWIMGIAKGQQGRTKTQVYTINFPGKEIQGWVHARGASGVSTDDTVPDPNARTWAAYTSGTYLDLSERTEQYSLAFYAYGDGTGDGDPNAGTFDCNVYVVCPYGSWERIGSFNADVGELSMTHYPVEGTQINSGAIDANDSYKWCEGKFVTALADNIWADANDLEGESNGIGRFNFKSHGAYGLIVLLDNISGVTKVYPIVKPR